ncbi:sigma 54-interacting transcriptional regulator [Erythrobacter sp. F6033]|uniref:sigma-54 interaction domain-containing protein n=1 Tax=Erythrobacter sp. F6033 TaxID=2926401 RepID=UPI001FF59A28|nr:sigma 54-interacting transcriptional regulator [Erythrobacter sp. F6033]MCK0129427.1 sigma 54-interacting transcriptional regulator [Erythrobacter sp. F6033]
MLNSPYDAHQAPSFEDDADNVCEGDFESRHRALLGTTLPLLAKDWQRDRIALGESGRFPCPSGGRRPDRIEIDLTKAELPSLGRQADHRIALAYSESSMDAARAAFLAVAAQGGWPIAADDHSLALLTLAQRIAGSEIPVLLEGPTGTGKEVLAQFVHRLSARSKGPFVAVNCAAMPEAMLEGLLFGHRKGAFTGAGEARDGLFKAADGGTLLLDELGELPLALQSKLLRALQEGEVLPLGATKPVRVDVRVVACTNRTLSAEVEAGRFREDLLYRLNVFPLELAALRDRPGDIAPLAFGMLLRHACRDELPHWISGQALALLQTHIWPGNVRELENVIRRAILLAGDSHQIGSEHIVFDQPVRPVHEAGADRAASLTFARAGGKLSDVAFQSEVQAILTALESHGGHRAKTARSLGISERTLRYRLASMRESGLLAAGGEA